MFTSSGRRLGIIGVVSALLASLFTVVLAPAASADGYTVDADPVLSGNQNTVSITAVEDTVVTVPTKIVVTATRNNNLPAGAVVTFTFDPAQSLPAGKASGTTGVWTVPSGWADGRTAVINVNGAISATLGVSSYTVKWTPTAKAANGSTLALGNNLNGAAALVVNATVTPKNTAPTVEIENAPTTVEGNTAGGAFVSYDVVVTDNEEPGLAAVCNPASGSVFPLDTTTITCSVTDAGGLSDSASVEVLVTDATGPVIDVPADATQEATGAEGATVSYDTPSATDVVDGAVAATCSPSSGSTFPLGATTVICSATDASVNSSSVQFNVYVNDSTPPAVQVPADITVEATGPGGANVPFSVTASDIVNGSITPTCSPTSGSPFAITTSTVNCAATDATGNTGSGSFSVTVQDTTAPSLDLPLPISVEASQPSGADVEFAATATDIVDGEVPVLCDFTSGSTFSIEETTVSCSATDAHGNTAQGSFTVTVTDTTPPELTLPEDQSAEASGPGGATVEFAASAVDVVNGGQLVFCVPASGSLFPLGLTTVNCTASDESSNQSAGSFTIKVVDTTAPSVSVPDDIVLEATGPEGAPADFTASALDVVDGDLAATCDAAPGTFALGLTVVTCTAEDAAGNDGSASFEIKVQDTTDPMLSLPANVTVEASGSDGATVSFEPTASDLVSGSTDVTCSPESGSLFALDETTTVSCGSEDAAGNAAEGSFTVKVVDTLPPGISVPDDIVTEATGPDGAVVTFLALATDLVDGTGPADCAPDSGSTFGIDTTPVTCGATDAHGNEAAEESFTVTVQDTTAPELSVPGNLSVEATGPDGAMVSFVSGASDVVDGPVPVECDIPSGTQLVLGSYLVTCSTSDSRGNDIEKSFTVTVKDTTAPELTVPDDIAVEATGPGGATASYATSATDIVDGATSVECTPISGSQFSLGSTTVTCTSTDAAGNEATEDFRVSVVDTTAPTIGSAPNLAVLATSPNGAPVTYAAPAATDLVSVAVAVTCTPPSGSQFGLGTTAVTCTASDDAGNAATPVSFSVRVDTWASRAQGFLPPYKYGGSGHKTSTFKLGSVVPTKFKLALPVTDAVVAITAVKVSGTPQDPSPTALSVSAADTTGRFRYDPSGAQYIYNLGTKNLSAGQWVVTATFPDGSTITGPIGLK